MNNLFGFESTDGTVSAYFDTNIKVVRVHGSLSAVRQSLMVDLNSPLKADRDLATEALTMLNSFRIVYA